MLPTTSIGTLLIILSGVFFSSHLTFSKLLSQQGWPYFRLYGIACLSCALGGFIALLLQREQLPERGQVKWLVFRGTFGVLTSFFSILAVDQGTPLGDVAALTSINMVVAAFLGRFVLGEPLRWIHSLALSSSMVGALLISKPSFLFGGLEDKSWLGYALALASGFTQACSFICSRKSAGCSAWMHFLSTMLQGGAAGFLFADSSMAIFAEIPQFTLLWVSLVTFVIFATTYTLSLGAMWCPVAVSATVTTAVRMGCSYASQALFFGEAVDTMSMAGAALMLASVVVMAGWRAPSETATAAREGSTEAEETASVVSEAESLASFIAAEFVDCSHHERAVRQRRASGGVPEIVGAVAAVATVAI